VREDFLPLPEGLTPHKLRHTFASLLFALGEDPVHVMGQLGHTDPAFSLRVYAHAMRRDGDEKRRLKVLVEGAGTPLLPLILGPEHERCEEQPADPHKEQRELQR
jgi:hypothetical protein